MRPQTQVASHAELQTLRVLSQRVGCDPLLTQASTGNSSMKLDGVLWIKASGKWMADAVREDILLPLDLEEVNECLRQGRDPADRYPGASLETALHATLTHRVVLHVHCVNTIAWAVRSDGADQLRCRLDGLRWQWIPYRASGVPLAEEVGKVFTSHPDRDIFILGNHGLLLGADDVEAVERLLDEVRRRLSIVPRQSHPADYTALLDLADGSDWELPDDDAIHALATDGICQSILARGLLYPCQAVFSDSRTSQQFQAVSCPNLGDAWQARFQDRSFLMIERRGALVRSSIGQAELAMLSGLAQVVQRLNASVPVRYLNEYELAGISSHAASRYRDRARRQP